MKKLELVQERAETSEAVRHFHQRLAAIHKRMRARREALAGYLPSINSEISRWRAQMHEFVREGQLTELESYRRLAGMEVVRDTLADLLDGIDRWFPADD